MFRHAEGRKRSVTGGGNYVHTNTANLRQALSAGKDTNYRDKQHE